MQIANGPQTEYHKLEATEPTDIRHSTLLRHLPRKTICRVHKIGATKSGMPLARDTRAPLAIPAPDRGESLQLRVAAVPAGDQFCCFRVAVKEGSRVKKLELSSTTQVRLSQQFTLCRGDCLAFEYLVFLVTGTRRVIDSSNVRSILLDTNRGNPTSLFHSSAIAHIEARPPGFTTSVRDSVRHEIDNKGQYDLQFIATVEYRNPGAEAHLLVKRIRITDRFGQVVKRLASLSCVGRVRTSH